MHVIASTCHSLLLVGGYRKLSTVWADILLPRAPASTAPRTAAQQRAGTLISFVPAHLYLLTPPIFIPLPFPCKHNGVRVIANYHLRSAYKGDACAGLAHRLPPTYAPRSAKRGVAHLALARTVRGTGLCNTPAPPFWTDIR